MNPILIPFSRVEQLEQATRSIGSAKAVFRFVGSCTLTEAATIYRRMELLMGSSKGRWMADEPSMKILRPGAEHYEALDLLELTLDLMELDLKKSVPMMRIRFDGVRATANEVITTADRSNVFVLLDDVTIESQRLSRVCLGLGFGNEDPSEASLTEEDLNWLMEDGALILAGELSDGDDDDDGSGEAFPGDGAEEMVGLVDSSEEGAGLVDGGEVLPGLVDGSEERAGSVDGSEERSGGVDGGEVLPGLVDGSEERAGGVDGGEVLSGLVDGSEERADLVHGGEVLEGGVGGGNVGDSENLRAWIELKEKTVISLLRSKIRKLRQAIVTAKGRSVSA